MLISCIISAFEHPLLSSEGSLRSSPKLGLLVFELGLTSSSPAQPVDPITRRCGFCILLLHRNNCRGGRADRWAEAWIEARFELLSGGGSQPNRSHARPLDTREKSILLIKYLTWIDGL